MITKIKGQFKAFKDQAVKVMAHPVRRTVGIGLAVLLLGMIVFTVFINNKVNFHANESRGSNTNELSVMPEVKTSLVEKKEISENVNTYGTISYYQKVNVSSKLEENAAKVNFDVGDAVSKGQVLAELRNEEIKLGLDIAKQEVKGKQAALDLSDARYKSAQQNIEKNIESLESLKLQEKQKKFELENLSHVMSNKAALLEVGGITREQFREIENNYTMSKMQYDGVVKQIQASEIGFRDSDIQAEGESIPSDHQKRMEILKKINTKIEWAEMNISKADIVKAQLQYNSADMAYKESLIRAPIDGLVAMRYVEPGEKVSKDKPLFTLIDIDSVYIEMPVPETEMPQIRQNQSIALKVDAYPTMKFNGVVETVYPMIDVKTRTATVRCKIRNQKLDRKRYLLLPGMFVRADITTSAKKESLVVPFEAMAQKDSSQIKLFLVKRSTTETNVGYVVEKWVPYTKIADNYIELAQGVDPGDSVAISGLDFLETGMKVKIKD